MTPILATSNLSIGYRQPRQPVNIVSSQLNLALQRGEMVCLLGPNGAGKSTLMRTLAGMQPPLDGSVKLEGDDVHRLSPSELARSLSIVLTERIDAGNLTAYELVSLGRYPYTDWMGRLRASDHNIVRWAIQVTTAESLSDRPVNQLSDGERQKVMIARALAQEPTIMLLDEPTAYLDLPRRVEIINMLRNLARQGNCAILLSTHDLDLALRNADRIWLLSNGGVMYIGTPEELVLNGAFAAVFHSEGLEFDSSQGTFKVQGASRGTIGLLGKGESTFWTARALERIGFEVVRDDRRQPFQVLVLTQNGTTRWKTIAPKGDHEHASLAELIQHLH
ncbi:ATP-binding cassette domain-containing protein [Chloroflexi bacterium TSY]|nr:ATP-binding cassette domain-containing protein [Chloroflexi bacterium TSY]